MLIQTKYSIGDVVWLAATEMKAFTHECPDCRGSRTWKAESPAGKVYEFRCPRCASGYMSDRDLSLTYTQFVPVARRLTIGSVRTDSADVDRPVEYMALETGVGAGNVYAEAVLHESEDAALIAARAMATKQNGEVEWVVKQYDKALQLCDYQLKGAQVELAQSRYRRMCTRVALLLSDVLDAETLEEAKKMITEYQEARD